jgi:WD40 repeat protein
MAKGETIMQKRSWHWLIIVGTAVLHLAACIQINQQYNTTDLGTEAGNETVTAPQTADIRPSPTPVAPFPGIVYETAAGLWQVEGYNQISRLATSPIITQPTSRQLQDFGVEDEAVQHAALSPDGNWLAMTRTEEDGQTTIWAVGLNENERVFLGNGTNAVWSPDGRFLIYSTDGRPQLALADQNFSQIHLNLPPGSQVITWLPVNE